MTDHKWEMFRRALLVGLSILVMLAWAALFAALWRDRYDPVLTDFVMLNWRVVIGLPFSCMGAFIAVALFKQADAPLEFEGLGFKFKGSAGEVILWVTCFLALVAAIRILAGEPPAARPTAEVARSAAG